MALSRRTLFLSIALSAGLLLDRAALALTRNVSVGASGMHAFVDEVSGTSTSTVYVGDTVQWNWAGSPHSTTSGTCSPVCMSDGLWDSGIHSMPFMFSHTFNSTGTFHYYCSVHLSTMQGTVVVMNPGPPPTVSSVEPTSGGAPSGEPFILSGTNFVVGASVTVGGIDAIAVAVTDSTHITADTPDLTPGTLNDMTVTNLDSGSATLPAGWFADFTDVPQADIFHSYVEKLIRNGVTAGCGGGNYCRDDAVRRDQMAVFLLKSEHGSKYVPPACTGVFPDVPCPGQFTDWVEQLAAEGVTAGCGGGNYCPLDSVTRQQMAVFLLKAKNGSGFVPPPCTGVFDDVPCPSQFADWIEKLFADGVTGGCQANPPLYCPTSPNTRGQMAVFLVKNFGLP